jgi:hypothetical protein
MSSNFGESRCQHCGAVFRLFTIFNRDMQGLCKAWKQKHERVCAKRSPEARLKWSKKYVGLDKTESSIVIDLGHPGFGLQETTDTKRIGGNS